MNQNKKDWPFNEPHLYATFATHRVMDGSEPILFVAHDAEAWQFIGPFEISMRDALLVALAEVVRRDPTVMDLADLKTGWQASREFVGGPLTRMPQPPIPTEEK